MSGAEAVFAPAVARLPVNKWVVAFSVGLGSLMGAIDSSIVNVALGNIRGTVGATLEEITWVSTGYVVATVLVMPLSGFLGRQFGQKRVYLVCLAVFLLGSMFCGTARSLNALVLWRVVQGFGAGALQPTQQAIMRQTFPPKEQAMAMAVFAMVIMIGPAIGPTLGGYIVDNYSWPWIFYINLPIGLLGIYMVIRFVIEPEDVLAANRAVAAHERKHLDWAGIALLTAWVSLTQYILEEGNRLDWFASPVIVAATLATLIALALFVVRELTATSPVVNFQLFKDRSFLSGTVIGGVMFAMLSANMFLLPVFMQEILGFTATQSGWALMPRALVMMIASPIVGRLYSFVSPVVLLGAGVLFLVAGAFDMSQFTLATGPADIGVALVMQGIGFALLFIPLTTVAMASIKRHQLADAAGVNSLVRQLGGSIGVAMFATRLGKYASEARASVGAHLDPTRAETWSRLSAVRGGLLARGIDAVTADALAIKALGGQVARQAMVLSFERVFFLGGLAFVVVLPLLLFLRAPRATGEAAPAPKIDTHVEV